MTNCRLPLGRVAEAYAMQDSGDVLKAIIEPRAVEGSVHHAPERELPALHIHRDQILRPEAALEDQP